MTNVGTLIRNKRIKKELSQSELGKKIGGVTNVFIAKLESGKRPVPKDRMAKICQVLSIPKTKMIEAMRADMEKRLFI